MKKHRRFERPNHTQTNTRAAFEIIKRFGFVMFIAILFLMLTFAVAFSQKRGNKNPLDSKADAAAKITTGDSFLQTGNGGKAISSYEDAALLDPESALPHYKIGVVYVRSANKDAALEAFRKAVSVDPRYGLAYKEMAEIYYTQKKGPEAVKAQEKFLELADEKEKDSGLVRYGYYLFMARDFAKANDVFGQAHQKSLLKDGGLRYYGLSLVEAADYASAQKIFEEYFVKSQAEASDYAAYGKSLIQLKQDSLAAMALQKSLSIDNKQTPVKKMLWETLYALGKSYYNKKQFALADSAFENLIELHPGVVTGYLWAGRAKSQLDPETENGLAKPSYEKVIEIAQTTPDKSKSDLKEAYSYLGYYYLVKNDMPQSKANWEKVLLLDPQDENARKALKEIK